MCAALSYSLSITNCKRHNASTLLKHQFIVSYQNYLTIIIIQDSYYNLLHQNVLKQRYFFGFNRVVNPICLQSMLYIFVRVRCTENIQSLPRTKTTYRTTKHTVRLQCRVKKKKKTANGLHPQLMRSSSHLHNFPT